MQFRHIEFQGPEGDCVATMLLNGDMTKGEIIQMKWNVRNQSLGDIIIHNMLELSSWNQSITSNSTTEILQGQIVGPTIAE